MKLKMRAGGSVIIGGRTFSGQNVSINNDIVTVDGVEQDGTLSAPIYVNITGHVEELHNSSGTVTADYVGSISTQSGDVNCKDVGGSVSTMSGDVHCDHVTGSVSTMSGDVYKVGK